MKTSLQRTTGAESKELLKPFKEATMHTQGRVRDGIRVDTGWIRDPVHWIDPVDLELDLGYSRPPIGSL